MTAQHLPPGQDKNRTRRPALFPNAGFRLQIAGA